MKFNNKIIFLLAIACIISFRILAQSGPGDSPGDPDVPLDGGLSIALVAGIGYGAKRLMKNKKERAEQNTGKDDK